jgi:hypothetical protein
VRKHGKNVGHLLILLCLRLLAQVIIDWAGGQCQFKGFAYFIT